MTQLILAAALAAGPAESSWPRFRGPNGTGVAEGTYPTEWSATKNLAWKADLPGKGVGGPAVAGGVVYVTAVTGYRQDRLHTLAFDLKTGKELWRRTMRATGSTACHPDTDMAAPTPAASPAGVFALFATGDLAHYDRRGNLRWYRALAQDYDVSNQVGLAASPVLHEGKLIAPMDNAGDSFLAAFDVNTGRTLWKVPRPRETNWVTPVVGRVGDAAGDRVIYQTREAVVAYDPATGTRSWEKALEGLSSIPSTVAAGGQVFVTANGVTKLKPGEGQPEAAWKERRLSAGYGSPLVYEGKVFAVSRSAVLACADAGSGKILWRERLAGGRVSASPLAAGGKVYVFAEDGTCSVIEPGGDAANVTATNKLGTRVRATPAMAGGRVLIRTDRTLYCVGG